MAVIKHKLRNENKKTDTKNAFKHFFVNTSSRDKKGDGDSVTCQLEVQQIESMCHTFKSLQEQLKTRLFKFSDEVALKTLHRTLFTVL